jgi:DNA-binding MarR family transcriptional regulator
MRAKFFKAELFADPAWDMLLDLYRAELDQYRVSVTSLCTASGVPTSTALRWLRALEEEGLITRRQDPLDGRRTFVALTTAAVGSMNAYFDAIGQTQPL